MINIFNSRHNMIGLYFEADAYRHKYHLTMYLIPTLYVSFSTDEKADFLGFKSYRMVKRECPSLIGVG